MPLRVYRAITPSQRFKTGLMFADITKTKPEKTLIGRLLKTGGRSLGRVTQRGKGGGHKRNLRAIDFKRDKRDIAAKVAAVEYDPNRTANIALLHFKDGQKRYILAPLGIKVGDSLEAGEKVEIKPGNALP